MNGPPLTLGGGPWFCASSAGALLFQQRFDLYGVFGRAGHGYAGVHFFKARHFFGGELEVEEGGVFSYALRVRRLWDYCRAALHEEAQRRLRGAFAVRGGDGRQLRVFEHFVSASLPERRVGHAADAVFVHPFALGAALAEQVHLYLVRGGRDFVEFYQVY